MAYRGRGGAVNDLVLIDDVSEEKIVECLENHHAHREPYQYVGPVLISVNPYQDIPNLYSAAKIKKYILKKPYENNPHVFALAESAYRSMVDDLSNECVIITGESGAGKTEAAKKVMEYIAAMSSKSREVQRVKDQLIESNPLLESFGNARTLRNDNSSRFGKYMEILFLVGDPAGGKITTYLLEKSRVVGQQLGERNFHIFYELLTDKRLRSSFNLGPAENYKLLSDSNSIYIDTIDDKTNFEDTKRAMEYIALSPDIQQNIFSIIAFLLHLGNIEFKSKGSTCEITNKDNVISAAKCLGVSVIDLEEAIRHRTVKSGVESVRTGLNKKDAEFARDSMAKSVYDKLFDFIVKSANEAIECNKFSTTIGVLDIFGFEILGVNGFEQVCINFTNEKLHQLFIELTLKAEQEEYKKEGIAWQAVKFYNNKPIVEMIESKGGLFSLLDEESIFPGATDQTLFNKLKANMKQREFERPNTGPDTYFRIKHYAGSVTYDVTGMLQRNKDTLFPDIVQCVTASNNSVAKSLFQGHQHNRKSVKVFKRAPTTCMQYKTSVAELMADLSKCSQNYIRCIKPNSEKSATMFDAELVATQCRYLGILEGVRVRRAGYAFRMDFDRFAAKYKCVLPDSKLQSFNGNATQVSDTIVKQCVRGQVEFGKRKLFIKDASSILNLEDKRKEFLETAKGLLPPDEEGLIFADKVIGFNEKFIRTNLIFCVGGRGFYWYNSDGTVAQFFPLDKLDFIGFNKTQGWMTIHMKYPSKVPDEFVNLTYLSEDIYSATVLNFVEVAHSMGYEKIKAREQGAYPKDAVDKEEYKALVKNIAKGEKPTVQRGTGKKTEGGCLCFGK